jgi:glycosyltransferase involved in cell wall biosynthesis
MLFVDASILLKKTKRYNHRRLMKPAHSDLTILLLGTQMEVAGAQRVLLSQAHWFQSHGYLVQAVFFYDKQGLKADWLQKNKFPIFSLEAKKIGSNPLFNPFRLIRSCWRLFLLLRRQVNVIISFTPHSNILGLPIAWLAGIPVRIGTHHGYIEGSSRLLAWFHGRLTNSWICSKMVAVSSQVRDYAVKREGADANQIAVIENGIDLIELRKPADKLLKRSQLGFGDKDVLILTVGRLTVQKGHTYLLDAIARINIEGVKYLFVGDGPLRAELEAKAKDLGISKTVFFLGVRSDIEELLFVADIFVQPSLWEGLSLALLEALMAGLPVVATRVEGVIDVVEDEKSALLVPSKDAEALAKALTRLISDGGLRYRLSAEGLERVKKSYSVENMCKSYESLIIKLLSNAR